MDFGNVAQRDMEVDDSLNKLDKKSWTNRLTNEECKKKNEM